MANPILIKRSAVAAKVPATTDLQLGELAINTVDGKLFLKKNNGADVIVEVGALPASPNFTGDIQLNNAAYLKSKLAAGTVTRLLGLNASNVLYIGSVDAAISDMIFTNGTERMRISSGGNLLINTQTDNGADKLQVAGSIKVNSNTTYGTFNSGTAGMAYLSMTYNGAPIGYIGQATGTTSGGGNMDLGVRAEGILSFAAGATERMRIATAGNVLIGTTTDDGVSRLQVGGAAKVFGDLTIKNAAPAAGADVGRILINGYTGANGPIGAMIDSYVPAGAAGIDFQDMRFYTTTGNVMSERLRIGASGNVMIGDTTDNGSKLQVTGGFTITAGNVNFVNNVNGGLGEHLKLTNAFMSAGSNVALSFVAGDQSSNPTSQILAVSHTADVNTIAGSMVFKTKASGTTGANLNEAMRITSIGNVLIGTQTDDGYSKLQVNGRINAANGNQGVMVLSHTYGFGAANYALRINGDAGTPNAFLSQWSNVGGFQLASGATTYGGGPWRTDGNATAFGSIVSYDGSIRFFSNVGLTPNTNFTPVERMRVSTAGNLLIGQLSDSSSDLLQVNGGATLGASVFGNGVVELGKTLTGDRVSFIDFHTDDTNLDYSFRLIRNAGVNGDAIVQQIGTGSLTMAAAGGVVRLVALGNERLRADASGILVTGTISETSTIRIKENVRQLEGGLDSVLAMRGVVYDLKDGSAKDQIGLIAEEVDEVLPALVQRDTDGVVRGVNYARMVAVLIEGMKAQEQRIKDLEAKVQELTNG